MQDLGAAAPEIEPGEPRLVPAALAGIGRDQRQRCVRAEQVELPHREIGGADLDRRAVAGGDREQPAPRERGTGDGGVLGLAPPQAAGTGRRSGIETAVGRQRDQPRAVVGPAQLLDRARDVAERTHRAGLEEMERQLAGQATIRGEGQAIVDRRKAGMVIAARAVGEAPGAAVETEAPDAAEIALAGLAARRMDGSGQRTAAALEGDAGGRAQPVQPLDARGQPVHAVPFASADTPLPHRRRGCRA